MKFKTFVYKLFHNGIARLRNIAENFILKCKLWVLDVKYHSVSTNGLPYLYLYRGGNMVIGKGFRMNNGTHGNPIGCFQKCTLIVDAGATLTIGDNVGISQTALIAADNISIGRNVKIGGGTCVWTTDFHSLDPRIRTSSKDIHHRAKAPVVIKDNAFIGAKVIVLKGVTIGENSIIGAGSVVTRSVPDNEIWAGNPAKFIRKV